MRTVMRELYRVEKTSKKGDKYNLYCYQLDDGNEVETVSEFNIGDKVEVWLDEKWDKLKMRRGREPIRKPKS